MKKISKPGGGRCPHTFDPFWGVDSSYQGRQPFACETDEQFATRMDEKYGACGWIVVNGCAHHRNATLVEKILNGENP